MLNRLSSLLKVRPEEGRLVLLVGALFLCFQAGQGMGENAASALFFLRYGVDFLPYMYIFLGAVTFVLTLGYSAGLGRFKRRQYFQALILGSIVLLLLERTALGSPFPILYPILWLTINCMGAILGIFIWNVAGEVSDSRQAKRLFPLFTSAGILGSVLGNSITGMLAESFGADNLLFFYAFLLAIIFFLTRSILKKYFSPVKPSGQKSDLWRDIRSGFDYVSNSSLMKLVAFASILFSILFFSIAFPFSKVVSAAYPDEASVAGFLGLFSSISTAVTFLVALLLANRVYSRLGIVNSVLLMPLTYFFGFAIFASQYTLNGAVIARFSQLVILSGIAGTAWNAFFNVVPAQKRSQVLAFQNGVPSQIGVALSGVLLILGERVLTTSQILLMGLVVTLVCGVLVWRMRAAYGQSLLDALRAGRLEVFSSDETAFAGLVGDAAALKVVTLALQDPKPAMRRIAAEILARMHNPAAIPALTPYIADPEPAVRAAVTHALGELHASVSLEQILTRLDDPDHEVRCQAIIALAQLQPILTPDLLVKLVDLMKDGSPAVRTRAAIALGQLGHADRALPDLLNWLAANDRPTRIAALETIAQVPSYFKPAFEHGYLFDALQDPAAAVRRAACQAFTDLTDPAAVQALAACLYDAEDTVRQSAAQVLRQHDQETRSFVLGLFASQDLPVDAALDALCPGDAATLAPLRLFARNEIVRVRSLRSWLAGLPATGRAVSLLRKRLNDQAVQIETHLIKIVGLLSSPETMELVRKNMNGANPESRSSALETLETLGDKVLAREIAAVLEERPLPATPETTIETLLESSDGWCRALAARAIPELGLQRLLPRLRELQANEDGLLRDAAREASIQFNEVPAMETLQTISTLERVLILHGIPIFTGLSPEDLEQIAHIAREEWHPSGGAICHQGEEGDVMYVIVSGQVLIVTGSGESEKIVAERGPGDFVGETAIIDPGPRSASMITKVETRVLAIEGEAFKAILRDRPAVSLAVMQSLSRRLRDMMN